MEPVETLPEGTSPFADLDLDPRLQRAVAELGFTEPTPIQLAAIPPLLAGRDVVGRARTGSGKTAAFGLPLLHRVAEGGPGRALVLAPTRELALQVTDALRDLAAGLGLRMVTVYGGAPYRPQILALEKGATVIVGTPGRLVDLRDKGALDLSKVDVVVLDEADEMLRMGFADDVEALLGATPPGRQVVLFSATMPEPIRRVAATYLRDPVEIEVEARGPSIDHIVQRFVRVPEKFKVDALIRVLRGEDPGATLVFARTRARCAEVADALYREGIPVEALHGDLDQSSRERVVENLRSGRTQVVVATDVAARGLDVSHLARVVNLDLPDDLDTYVHRIGRTGRAGATGQSVSFVTPAQGHRVRLLERVLKRKIEASEVPSDAVIAAKQRVAVGDEIAKSLADPDLEAAAAFLRETAERLGRSLEEVAAAALLRSGVPRVALMREVDDGPPFWARAPKKLERGEIQDEVPLFLPVGRRHGVGKGDIVGALTHGLGLPGDQIGRIVLEDRKSFVGLPRPVAERLLAEGVVLELRGNPVKPQPFRAPAPRPRPDADRPPGDRPPGRPDRKFTFKKRG